MKYTLEYVDSLPNGYGGICYTPAMPLVGTCRIEILKKYHHDIGILQHELQHVKQYRRCLFHNFLYKNIRSYRYKCELEAFTAQIQEYGYTSLEECKFAIDALETKYNLKYTRNKIEADLLLEIR